jgi:predicted RNA-binding Zn ribbon-like protein
VDRFDTGRQPGGRSPAPGRLGYAQAFVNSFWDLDAGGRDRWADADGYARWLRERGFATEGAAAARREALAVREALRALAYANHGGAATDDGKAPGAALALLDAAAADAPLRLRFLAAEPPRHDAIGATAAAATALALAVVAESMADGTWWRLKACPGPHCGWAYYDASRNRASQWCSMAICGNRAKGAAFRARRAREAA